VSDTLWRRGQGQAGLEPNISR